MRLLYTIAIVLVIQVTATGSVVSTTGNIFFDIDSDTTVEAVLNSTGFGIGMSPSSHLSIAGNAMISNQLTVGSAASQSNLNIGGTLGFGIANYSSNATLGNDSYVLADSSTGNLTMTLPYSVNHLGKKVVIKKMHSSHKVLVQAQGSPVEGRAELIMNEGSTDGLPCLTLISTSDQWRELGRYGSIGNVVAEDNLILYYGFEETSGNTVNDLSQSFLEGTLHNMNFTGNVSTGKIGQALTFDGTDDHITSPHSGNINALSVTCWFKRTSDVNFQNYIVSFSNGVDRTLEVSSKSNEKIHFRINSHSGYQYGDGLFANQWHFIAVVWSSSDGSVSYHINGTLFHAVTTGNGDTIPFDVIYVGRMLNDHRFDFPGQLDDIRIYNKKLSEDEIYDIYQSGND